MSCGKTGCATPTWSWPTKSCWRRSITHCNNATGGAGPGATFKWKGSGFPKALKVAKSGALAGTPSTKLVPGTVYHPTVSVTETVITHNGKKKVKTKTVATKVFTLTVG